MPGSFIDFLPPEAQSVLGGIALLMAVLGLVVWGAGIKIARFAVAMLFGLGGAVVCAVLLPRFLGIAELTGAMVGFAIGAIAGALEFKFVQGTALAICLSIAVGGTFYRWHVAGSLQEPAASSQGAVRATDLLVPTERLPAGLGKLATMPAVKEGATEGVSLVQKAADFWGAIPAEQQKRLLAVTLGTAVSVLLVAFGFPRQTTWVATAMIGSLMILAGVNALLHVYGPQYQKAIPATVIPRYIMLGALTLAGMVVQWRYFWPRKKTDGGEPTPVAAVAVQS